MKNSAYIDFIPVIWTEPQNSSPRRQLVIFLHYLGGTKESIYPFLEDLAAKGFVALSFDAWQHGERGDESQQAIFTRVFGNFRYHMWPILGQTVLDTLRVIDWAIASLNIEPQIYLAGISMGGDIAVAAAGIDSRIKRVAAVVSTPDWLRPGMEDLYRPGTLLPPGKPDSYAQYFYDQMNPLTHLASFARAPEIHFFCGEKDTHVPPDNAFQFKSLLKEIYPSSANKVSVTLIAGLKHLDVQDKKLWWPICSAWLCKCICS